MSTSKNSIHKKIRNLVLLSILLLTFFARPVSAAPLQPQGVGPGVETAAPDLSDARVRVLYFYSNTCSHCIKVIEEIVKPLQNEYAELVDFRLLELGERVNYEALMAAENQLETSGSRDLPVVVVGERVLIGEEENTVNLRNLVVAGIEGEPIALPELEGVDYEILITSTPEPVELPPEACSIENPENCSTDAPIYIAYFYQTGCKECARAETDLAYLLDKYPQIIIEEFNINDEVGLFNWMSERVERVEDLHTPAIFIGNQAWIGEEEIRVQSIEPVIEDSLETGSARFWNDYDPEEGTRTLMDRFEKLGWVAVVLAGLVDGLNPCAFATIIFFVSYLTLSGHKGKQILFTGASFTLGVFLAYLAVGLGFYKVLDVIKEYMNVLSKIVYALTAVFCLVLAFMSIRDYFKAREGKLDDMAMNLPEPLRKRINATVREGRKSSSYYLSAFVVGLVVSILELACTGQIYLPVIISMSTIPEMRDKALLYLVLYNLMFIVPLIVVFVLAFYGTTSKQFSAFLKKHAAAVKIGMAIVFVSLAVWLISSLLA
ncbi:MAG: cytochrome c biogenesis CcdA family protein [Anaerolineaceae bacterium]|nr:cytochrome c biogenesis CcdA family protein [Anaerolineaceae bacterium]MDD4043579.1 cytochrome c biogenesis CcdA family protein [Anaerolineaceae bacterium]MDD4578231.1 cytochrome c biogenesis CcdA family protein [Anaerolineaceae bacterium]